jgi:MoxR-like ATPase
MRQNMTSEPIVLKPVISAGDILRGRTLIDEIYIDEKIEQYILDIVFATRNPAEFGLEKLENLISYGASPRASIYLATAARALAFIRRRGYIVPEDVRSVAFDVLRHRIAVSYEAEAEGINSEHIIQDILNTIPVP